MNIHVKITEPTAIPAPVLDAIKILSIEMRISDVLTEFGEQFGRDVEIEKHQRLRVSDAMEALELAAASISS